MNITTEEEGDGVFEFLWASVFPLPSLEGDCVHTFMCAFVCWIPSASKRVKGRFLFPPAKGGCQKAHLLFLCLCVRVCVCVCVSECLRWPSPPPPLSFTVVQPYYLIYYYYICVIYGVYALHDFSIPRPKCQWRCGFLKPVFPNAPGLCVYVLSIHMSVYACVL